MSARKIGFLILILLFGATVEVSWHVREHHWSFGPEGLRVLGGRFYGPSFEFEESAEHALEAEGTLELEVRNAFGDVRVVPGDEKVARVHLRKVVFQPTEEKARAFAERVELEITADEDGRLRIGTNREEASRGEKVGLETHLEVQVPPDTVARVRNDHGAVDVQGVASAQVRTAFEDVRVEGVRGEVTVDARHGRVEVADVGAALTLESRHGDVEVRDVEGPAELDVQHGTLAVRRVAGLSARVAYGEAVAENVTGDVKIQARHAGARAADVTGGVEIETSYADIRVEGAGGPISARVSHGDAHLAPGTPIVRAIDAAASDGEIRLDVPEGSRFELDAESRHGDVRVDVPGLEASVSEGESPRRATGVLGEGEARVTLRARGDITLEAAPADLPAEAE